MKTATFNKRFIQHTNQLYGYIKGMVNNDDVAKDLIQDLYLKLYSSRQSIKEESARFFFFRSAKNHCIDWFRKNAANRTEEFTFDVGTLDADPTEQEELTHHFRSLINTLPEQQKEVIYLKDVCEMSTAEIIEITNLKENNVRVNLSRARDKIKKGLAKIYHYEATIKS